ncbi:MAG: hypothetical protein WBP81_20290 [Solirubrobacteraceae bacterium]
MIATTTNREDGETLRAWSRPPIAASMSRVMYLAAPETFDAR